MKSKQEEFKQRLLETFREEAAERIAAITECLIDLESISPSKSTDEIIELAYRAFHSLKGAARAVSNGEIEHLCQAAESALGRYREQGTPPPRNSLNAFHRAVDVLTDSAMQHADVDPGVFRAVEDALKGLLDEPLSADATADGHGEPHVAAPHTGINNDAAANTSGPTPVSPDSCADATPRPKPGSQAAAMSTAIRVPTARLEAVMRDADEFRSVKLRLRDYIHRTAAIRKEIHSWQRTWHSPARRPSARPIADCLPLRTDGVVPNRDSGHDLSGLLHEGLDRLKQLAADVGELEKLLRREEQQYDVLSDSFSERTKELLMQPCAGFLSIIPKMARDIAQEFAKTVEVKLSGQDVEIDKRVADAIKDPIVHVIRNSIAHGIETEEERRRAGKPPTGTIAISVERLDSASVEIVIEDDGRGLDAARIAERARECGIVDSDAIAALNENDVLRFVFSSGLSTSENVDTISGRGLGLAIVRDAVLDMGGDVIVESKPGAGATFRLRLPVTRASSRGTIVRCGGQLFVIPTRFAVSAGRTSRNELLNAQFSPRVFVRDEPLALVDLSLVLGQARTQDDASRDSISFVVVQLAHDKVALAVDDVISDQEIVVKSLPASLAQLDYLEGATILGDGSVVPVLNMRAMERRILAHHRHDASNPIAVRPFRKTALVVEDSLTSRVMLKEALESAQYTVHIACDGKEAWDWLNDRTVDVVVSDIQMPRMDGLELTRRIRKSGRLKKVPIVLVTSLETPQDKKNGMDCGANAYIVKSAFENEKLVETVEGLT